MVMPMATGPYPVKIDKSDSFSTSETVLSCHCYEHRYKLALFMPAWRDKDGQIVSGPVSLHMNKADTFSL